MYNNKVRLLKVKEFSFDFWWLFFTFFSQKCAEKVTFSKYFLYKYDLHLPFSYHHQNSLIKHILKSEIIHNFLCWFIIEFRLKRLNLHRYLGNQVLKTLGKDMTFFDIRILWINLKSQKKLVDCCIRGCG